MDRVKRIWYLSPMRAAQSRQNLRCSLIQAMSQEEPSNRKARSLAPLNVWACAVKMCHDRMLEDTNSLDGAHIFYGEIWKMLKIILKLLSNTNLICFAVFIDCGSEYVLENGYVEFSGKSTTFNNSIPVTCSDGYKNQGEDHIFCQANGTWTEHTACQIRGMWT